jgi:hypothetical protein
MLLKCIIMTEHFHLKLLFFKSDCAYRYSLDNFCRKNWKTASRLGLGRKFSHPFFAKVFAKFSFDFCGLLVTKIRNF